MGELKALFTHLPAILYAIAAIPIVVIGVLYLRFRAETDWTPRRHAVEDNLGFQPAFDGSNPVTPRGSTELAEGRSLTMPSAQSV